MKSTYVLLLAIAGVFAVILATLGMSYVSAFNTGNSFEQRIKAQYESNQNNMSQYQTKIIEMAQVPDMYRDDLAKIIKETMEGRYGDDGVKSTITMISEQNPNLDPSMYTKIQQAIEAGRNDFKVAQDQLIDVKRSYETALGSWWGGMWLRIAGYPKIKLDDYKILKTDKVVKQFEEGRDEAIILRKKSE